MKVFSLLFVLGMSLGTFFVSAQSQHLDEIRKALAESDTTLGSSDISDLVITDMYQTRHNEITHVYASQAVNGKRVYNSAISAAITADGSVKRVFHRTYTGLSGKTDAALPAVDLSSAVAGILARYAPEISASIIMIEGNLFKINYSGPSYAYDTKAELCYWVAPYGEVKLAWIFDLDMPSGKNWWQFIVSSSSGEELKKIDWQVSCDMNGMHQSDCGHQTTGVFSSGSSADGSGYNIFPFPVESPIHGMRDLTTEPALALASPFGWHDTDGLPGADFTITRGNNAYAYEDANDLNEPGFSPDGGIELDFDFPLDLNAVPQTYTSASVTNLFYANNRIHDILYTYGFDEPSGNFQQNNYGNGGLDNDWVRAEAQDGGGTNNANMATPPDGNRPRMQMYLWSGGTSVTELLTVNDPESISGNYLSSNTAAFGPTIPLNGITADVVLAEDGDGINELCSGAINATELDGKIALIDRGNCVFTDKVLNAQAAGALAVIIVNNVPGGVIAMGGDAPGINIPSIMISLSDGSTIKSVLDNGETVNATLGFTGDGSGIKDGSFDNGIVVHEYIHGLSNRLTGGPSASSCLGNEEQMGEGWSDWYCIMMTMNMDADNPVYRPIGTFASAQAVTGQGIRPVAYDTSFSVNDYTYADLNNGNISVPHGVGFIWSTMLWDLTWALIDEYGFDSDLDNGTAGNNIAMQLVTDGLKLQVCEPGFVDGRDAILLADEINNDGANTCLIWNVFAKRGLGFSADQGSTNSRADGIAAFDTPVSCEEVFAPPTAMFEMSTTSTCNGLVNFTDLSTDIPQGWTWDFGDGNSSDDQNPTHQYDLPGIYTVTLTVTNTLGEDVSVGAEPIVFTPVPAPEVSDVEGCAGALVNLSGTTSEGEIYWYDASSTFVGAGNNLDVTLGEESENFTAIAVVDEFEAVYIGPENGDIGSGNFHGGSFTGTIDFQVHEPLIIVSAWVNTNNPGERIIKLWNAESANGTIVNEVTVDIASEGWSRIYLNLPINEPGVYSLGLNMAGLYRSNSGVSYPYEDGEGLMTITGGSDGPNRYYYFYDIEVDKPFCESEPVTVQTTLTGNTDFIYGINGLDVSFMGSSESAGWIWDFGDGNISTLQNPEHTYASEGIYTVTLTTSDGCSRERVVDLSGLVGVQDGRDNNMFTIDPNPANQNIQITLGALSKEQTGEVSFYNISGQVVKRVNLTSGSETMELDVSSLADGMYMVVLRGDSGEAMFQQRIIIAH